MDYMDTMPWVFGFVILMFLGLVLLLAWENLRYEIGTPDFPEERFCEDNLHKLSCEDIMECYDWCERLPYLATTNECRMGYMARIIECYGS